MSNQENNIITINQWFQKKKKAEFSLPDRHFGKPCDYFFTLEKIYMSSENLHLEFDTNINFIFSGKVTVQENDNKLEISSFNHLVFTWEDFSAKEIHLEEYFEGKVIFMPDPYTEIHSSWNRQLF